jgi:hypothetical protein
MQLENRLSRANANDISRIAGHGISSLSREQPVVQLERGPLYPAFDKPAVLDTPDRDAAEFDERPVGHNVGPGTRPEHCWDELRYPAT